MDETASPTVRAPRPISKPLVLVALGMWALLAFGHGVGLDVAYALFSWAQKPGNWLCPEGGSAGQARFELILTSVFLAIAGLVLGNVIWRLRGLRPTRRALLEELVTWAVWACLVVVIFKVYIVYATEFVHFAQYALIGCLFALALGGDRPQQAFLCTFALGFLDEIWQHYGLHLWLRGDVHYMDWSDEVLDGLGAVGGILPFVTLRRLRGEEVTRDTSPLLRRAVVVAALLLLPLLLLDPVQSAWLLGTYPSWYPTWGEYLNHKPTHWPAPRQGIPLLLAALFVLGTLVEPRRKAITQGGLLLLVALLLVSIEPFSRRGGMPVHEVVPTLTIPRARGPIAIDGRVDEAEWAGAARVGPFVSGSSGKAAGMLETHARLVWDDQALYVAFECSDPDVWYREAAAHDDRGLPGDEVVELFLDDGGDEITYVEVEVSPRNVTYDLWNFIPAAPVDHDPYARFIGLYQWEAQGLETAAQVDGTADATVGWGPVEHEAGRDLDRGWTVELRFPWEALRTTTTPSSNTVRGPQTAPKPGERWRLNLCRVERPRPMPEEVGAPGETIDAAEARRLLGAHQPGGAPLSDKDWGQVLRDGLLTPDAEQRFPRGAVVALSYGRPEFGVLQLQTWAPAWQPSFHQPRFFGAVTFGE